MPADAADALINSLSLPDARVQWLQKSCTLAWLRQARLQYGSLALTSRLASPPAGPEPMPMDARTLVPCWRRVHVQKILRKLAASNRAQAVAQAMSQQLLSEGGGR